MADGEEEIVPGGKKERVGKISEKETSQKRATDRGVEYRGRRPRRLRQGGRYGREPKRE